jgi:hypothetical protein
MARHTKTTSLEDPEMDFKTQLVLAQIESVGCEEVGQEIQAAISWAMGTWTDQDQIDECVKYLLEHSPPLIELDETRIHRHQNDKAFLQIGN